VPPDRNFWRRVHLLENGELLAIFDPYGVIKLDRDSNLLWATEPGSHFHHDLDVADDGRIFVLGKRSRVIAPLHPGVKTVEDLVIILDPAGRELDRFSIYEAFIGSPFAEEVLPYLRATAEEAAAKGHSNFEDFHTNTLDVFDGSMAHLSPLFAKGNMLFCSPHSNNVFIIDGETRRVVWNWSGPWYRIHEPQLVPGGRFLLFHNNGYQETENASEVLEYDLLTRELMWSYGGVSQGPEDRFFSGTSSTVARLGNGNTLVVVTEAGRTFEVTPDHEVAWDYLNPRRAGDRGELIAAIFQHERIADERVEAWLPSSSE
jgi:hypothetical protein